MKIYIAQVLVEDTDLNNCHCEVFTNHEQARAYAKKEIESYAKQYNGQITGEYTSRFSMQAGDAYVAIEIVEKELEVKTDTDNFVPDIIEAQVSNIDWDTDGDEEVLDSLPQEVTVEINLQDQLSDAVSDAISELVGYCHRGFEMKFNK